MLVFKLIAGQSKRNIDYLFIAKNNCHVQIFNFSHAHFINFRLQQP